MLYNQNTGNEQKHNEHMHARALIPRHTRRHASGSFLVAGFGGSCFQKDVLSLVYLCESLNLRELIDIDS